MMNCKEEKDLSGYQCKYADAHIHAYTHIENNTVHVPAPFHSPPLTSHLSLLSPTLPSFSLSLSLSPLELSPLFVPALPQRTSTLLSSCENCVCV